MRGRHRHSFLLIVLVAIVTIGCSHFLSQIKSASVPSAHQPGNAWALPNRHLSPGLVMVHSTARICPHVDPALEAMRPDEAVKLRVYARYGIAHHYYEQYEVDHIVPVELGGADTVRNLWPEPNNHPSAAQDRKLGLDPSYILNTKDQAEDVVHQLVCDGKLSLSAAQHGFEHDWVKMWRRYVRPELRSG